ncbi:hypothetical protein KEM52_001361 [Ascosphaera acerosa]|nr:hypothetical protein KEM52_001361 [Ascosphaera acerosa]
MHLLTAARSKVMPTPPLALPPAMYDTAARFVAAAANPATSAAAVKPTPPVPAAVTPARVASPLSKTFGGVGALSPQTTGMSAGYRASMQSAQAGTVSDWLITPALKQQFDSLFAGIDRANTGFLSGDQAVEFFAQSTLSEEVLAQIWDLADIDTDGQLNRDEFAVAMYLIRQQRASGGKEPLPATLPPALVSPSMRHLAAQPPAAAPAPTPAPAPAPAPRSAADDLFGLDVFTQPSAATPAAATPSTNVSPTAPLQVPQATGGSHHLATASPIAPISRNASTNQSSTPGTPTPAAKPLPAVSPAASSNFKPFVPTSSFGQSLAPQLTGPSSRTASSSTRVASTASATTPAAAAAATHTTIPAAAAPAASVFGPSQPQPQPLAGPSADDLLGDADQDESKKLTGESVELANLSNQIGTLSREMQNVHEKRVNAETELAQTSSQKRDFEARLAQARTMYQSEVDSYKALEERLKSSRADTGKTQAEYALIEGQCADLRAQADGLAASLEADVAENAALKEKIKAANAEIAALKPQLEKLKADARQQKGLVAINKKQLATLEAEKERLAAETQTAAHELDEAQQEVKVQTQLLSERQTPSPAVFGSKTGTPISAGSGSNPFFRRPASQEPAAVPSPAAVPAVASPLAAGAAADLPATQRSVLTPEDKESLFDDVFGPMPPALAATDASRPQQAADRPSAPGTEAHTPVLQAQSPSVPAPAEVESARAISPLPSMPLAAAAASSESAGQQDESQDHRLPNQIGNLQQRTTADIIRDVPGSFPETQPATASFEETLSSDTPAVAHELSAFDIADAVPASSGTEETTNVKERPDATAGEAAPLTSSAAHTLPVVAPPTATNAHHSFSDEGEESSSDEEGPEVVPGYKPDDFPEVESKRSSLAEFPSVAAHSQPEFESHTATDSPASPTPAAAMAASTSEHGASAAAPPPSQAPPPPVASAVTPVVPITFPEATGPVNAAAPPVDQPPVTAAATAPAPVAAVSPPVPAAASPSPAAAPAPAAVSATATPLLSAPMAPATESSPVEPPTKHDELEAAFAGVTLMPVKAVEGSDGARSTDEQNPVLNFDWSFPPSLSVGTAPATQSASHTSADDFFNAPPPGLQPNGGTAASSSTRHEAPGQTAANEDWDAIFAGLDSKPSMHKSSPSFPNVGGTSSAPHI